MLVPVTMHKAEKFAIDMRRLSDDDRGFFMKNFGCARKVYNLYIDFLYRRLEAMDYDGGAEIPAISLPEVTEFKKMYPYLKEADSLGLANAKIAFERAVKRYNEECDHVTYTKRALRRDKSGTEKLSFRGLKGMPKFHAKAQGDFSYTTNCQHPGSGSSLKQDTIRLEGSMLYIPKRKNGIRLIVHRPLPTGAVIGNATISMDTDGVLYASIGYTYETTLEVNFRQAAVNGDASILESLNILGLDYSQRDFYVDSEGRKANSPHCYRKSEEKLARLQRQISRMENGSNNYKKQLKKIQKLNKKIANQRKDFIEQESCHLARSYDAVAVEDIDLRAMGGAMSLGKNLHDNGFGMFRNALERKLSAKGSVLVKVDRLYPSTKRCHVCGQINPEVVLGVQEWDCPCCGVHHLRDENAAVNIRNEGKRVFLEYLASSIEEEAKAQKRAAALSEGRHRKKSA